MSKFRQHNTRAARLTPEEVYQIRQEYEAGTTQGELCRKYGVSVGTIGRIVRGETWNQFQGPRAVQTYDLPRPSDSEIQESERRLRESLEPTSQRSEEVLAKLAEAVKRTPEVQLDEFLTDKVHRYGFQTSESGSEPPASEAGDNHTPDSDPK